MKTLLATIVLFAAAGAGAFECHVNPAAAPGGDGSAAKPFADLISARQAVRNARKQGKIAANERVDVLLADGDYVFLDGLWLEKQDSGASAAAPVTWRAVHPGKARIVGGARIAPADLRPVADAAVLARLPENARARVRVADLSAHAPKTIAAISDSFCGRFRPPFVFCDHAHGTLARWPNKDVEARPGDRGTRGWALFKERIAKGGETVTNAAGKVSKACGAFVFDNPRAARWNPQGGFWLNGYWTHDWHNQSVKAAPFETRGTNRVMRLAAQISYGIMGGTWGRKERRFFVFNLLEEIDEPGEWWIDREKKLLYFYPPNANAETFVSFLSRALVTMQDVRHVHFDGVRFEYGACNGVNVNGGEDVRFANCTVANFGGSGVSLSGKNHALVSCELCNLGEQGASLYGGDRRTLTPSGIVAENCRVHDYALYQRTYAAAFGVNGCGVTLRGNEMFNAPHCAVLYGGNEHLFESNDVHHVLLETGDAGAYYTGRDWTTQGNVLRYNFTHELGEEGESANTMGFYFDDCDCGDEVYGNVFWRVARGIMVGGGRDHPIRDNVFAECRVGMSIDCRGVTWKKHWNSETDSSWQLTRKAEAVGYKSKIWAARYPTLAKILDDHPREPLYDPVERNVFIDCTQSVLQLDGSITPEMLSRMAPIAKNVFVHTYGTNKTVRTWTDKRIANGFKYFLGAPNHPVDLGFADPAKGDFRLKPDARLNEEIPGFAGARAVRPR